jgi:hypothetical protein
VKTYLRVATQPAPSRLVVVDIQVVHDHVERAVIGILAESPTKQAYHILHFAFVVAPIIAGVDKFSDLPVN